MSDATRWVMIRSAHVVRTPLRVPGKYATRCGKIAEGVAFEDLAGYRGRTCEVCLRLLAKDAGL